MHTVHENIVSSKFCNFRPGQSLGWISATSLHAFRRIHPDFGDVGVIYEGKAVHAVHVKYSRPESYYHNYMGVYYTGV